MTTDLEQSGQIVNLKTGEALTLDSDSQDLARYLEDNRELRSILGEADKYVSRELIRRMDAGLKWTLHLEGFGKVSGPSPALKEEWDGADLYARLMDLADQKVLTVESVSEVVQQEISFKVRKAGVNALRKLPEGHPARVVVEELCVRSEPSRDRVTVSRG